MVKIMIESNGEKHEIETDFAIIMSKNGETDEPYTSATWAVGRCSVAEMLRMFAAGVSSIIDNHPNNFNRETLGLKFIDYFADAMSGMVKTEVVKNTITPVTGGD